MIAEHEVAVLLCTYNGERHLSEQLASIAEQETVVCDVYVSDDGSSDQTLKLLDQFAPTKGVRSLDLRFGPGRGFAANFLSLVTSAIPEAPYYAFSDQDDIWDPDKLARGVAALAGLGPGKPALYCSRTRFVSEGGASSGHSPRFLRPPAFSNALVQNIAGGNTMVFNAAAMALLRAAGPVDVPAHDWWVYLLISGAGGDVIYDLEPGLSYRQHPQNVIGSNTGKRQRVRRYLAALDGRNREWNQRNLQALEQSRELLTEPSLQKLRLFQALRSEGVLGRLRALGEAGFYAQTWTGNLGLFIATLLKKM